MKNKIYLTMFNFLNLEYYTKMNEKTLFMPKTKQSQLLLETARDLNEYLPKTDYVHYLYNNNKNYPQGTEVCKNEITKIDNCRRNALL